MYSRFGELASPDLLVRNHEETVLSPSEAIERGRAFRDEPPPSPPAIAPRLVSVADAARYAGVATRSVRYWIAAGVLRRVKCGRGVRLDRVELDRLIDAALRGRDLPSRPKKATKRPRGEGAGCSKLSASGTSAPERATGSPIRCSSSDPT